VRSFVSGRRRQQAIAGENRTERSEVTSSEENLRIGSQIDVHVGSHNSVNIQPQLNPKVRLSSLHQDEEIQPSSNEIHRVEEKLQRFQIYKHFRAGCQFTNFNQLQPSLSQATRQIPNQAVVSPGVPPV
jgi:hypothetical protein